MQFKVVGDFINKFKFGGKTDATEVFKKMSKAQQAAILSSSALTATQKELLIQNAGLTASQTANTASTTGLTAAMTGLGASIKSTFIALATNPLTWVAAATVAVIALEDALTVDYSEANNALQESSQKYQKTKSNLESLNSELETTQSRITELQGLKDAGTITVAEKVELENLQSQNAELERKIQLQEKSLAIQSQEAINNAKEAMTKEDHSVAQSVKMGDSKGEKKFRGEVGKSTDTKAIKDDLALIKEYEAEIPSLEEKIVNLKKETSELSIWDDGYFRKNIELKETEKELKRYQDSINTLYSDLDSRSENIQVRLDALKIDPSANAAEIKELEKALDSIISIDLSPTEKALKSLDSYFDGTTGKNFIKEQLVDAAKNGKNLENVLSNLGIKLDDLGDGVTSDTLKEYFDDIAESANEAANAVKEANNNLTMDDIKTAFESKNAGDDYVALNDYLKKAKELYDQGLVGTDDFKSVAEAISYHPDPSAESFIKNYKKLQRYFTEDNDGNLTGQGINNFLTDLEALGKGYAKWNNEAGKWDINMDNTAQAAKDLDVSVQTMEAILGRIKDYDGVGDFDFRSAIKDFDTAKTSLEGLRNIYEEMQSGDKKKLLGDKLSNWESQLNTWENDLATLDTDIIMNIQLEYDLATIQAQIDEVQELINSGQDTVGNHAQVIAGNQKYINTSKEGLGLDKEGIKVPVEYEVNESSIDTLKAQLKNATSDKDKVKIQAEIENLQELQKQLLDSFSEAHPEINAESSIEEINSAWESFIASTEGQEILAKITADTDDAKSKVAEILGIDPEDITVDIKANDEMSDTITSVLSHLMGIPKEKVSELIADDNASDVVIGFLSSISGIPTETLVSINASDGATGVVTFVLSELLNIPEEKITELLATDGVAKIAEQATRSIKKVPDDHNTDIYATDNNATSTANNVNTAVRSIPDNKTVTISAIVSSSVDTAINTVQTAIKGLHGGAAKISGTAHAAGTLGKRSIPSLLGHAYAKGSIQNGSWLNPQWETKKDDFALTGETSPEMVVNPKTNTWWTVGDKGAEFSYIPKGSIVFNGKQTAELLKNGFTNSRGTAYLSGTAYAGGANGSFSFSGGATNYNKPSKKKPSSKPSSSKSNSSNNSSDTSEKAEEFKETIDYIEMKIDRIERQIKNLERVAGSAYNTFSKRNTALRDQISSITEEISTQQAGYDRYIQQANSVSLSENYKSQVRDGAIDISTITDEELAKNIKEYQEWYEKALDCRDAVEELKESVRDLYAEAFDNIITLYDGILGQLEHRQNILEGYIDQTEAQGYIISTKYYDALISNELDRLKDLTKERQDLINSMNDAIMNGNIEEGSEQWYEFQSEINGVNEAIQEANTNLIEFGNSIRDIGWEIFDKIQDRISGITDESDFLVELLSSNKLFDDKGLITDEGKATMGLHGVNYNTYMSQADEYRKEMEKIQSELSKDPHNQTLVGRRKELLELQQESILAAEDEKEAIKDLVEDGINKQLDSLQELINKYNDMMDAQKDMYDYQKEIAEKQKKINEVEKQMASFQGDDSEEGAATRQELKNELNDLKADMEETQYQKAIAEQKKLLDELYTEYETVLNMRLDNIDLLIMDVIGNVNSESSAIRDTIVSEAESVGYKLTDTMTTIWGSMGNTLTDGTNKITGVITTYGDKFTSSLTGVQAAINDLKNLIQQAVNASDEKAKTDIDNANKQQTEQTSKPSTPKPSTPVKKPTSSNNGGDGVPRVGDAVTFTNGKYFYSSDGKSPNGSQMLGRTVYITKINNKSWATKPYHISKGSSLGSGDLGWVSLNQLKGYKTGTESVEKDQWAWTNENNQPETVIRKSDGAILTRVHRGDQIYNSESTKNLWNLVNNPGDYIKRFHPNAPSAEALQPVIHERPAATINNEIQFNVNIDHVQDYNDFARQLQKDPKFERLIQTIAFSEATGHGRLAKFNIKF